MKRNKPEEGDNNAWMSTFSDLLMLMLTFFVLLLTMSSMDAKEVKQAGSSGIQILNGSSSEQYNITPSIEMPKIAPIPAIKIKQNMLTAPFGAISKKYADVSEKLLSNLNLKGKGWITRRPDGVDVHLDGSIAFEPGSSNITPASKRFLEEFATMIQPKRVDMTVVTYVGAQSKLLKDEDAALELALSRADLIATLMMKQGVPQKTLDIVSHNHKAGSQSGSFLQYGQLLTLKVTVKPETEARR